VCEGLNRPKWPGPEPAACRLRRLLAVDSIQAGQCQGRICWLILQMLPEPPLLVLGRVLGTRPRDASQRRVPEPLAAVWCPAAAPARV